MESKYGPADEVVATMRLITAYQIWLMKTIMIKFVTVHFHVLSEVHVGIKLAYLNSFWREADTSEIENSQRRKYVNTLFVHVHG